ncbi:DUF6432 family protein [Natronomonas sp. EA1]|uniref:DUF6432 family protein n=1 Tax=Natronomonas sp. EA1 TaxID=3421655 RepID=UPI003EC11E7D
MQAKREFRDRDETQVAVLDALVERNGEGMTVFEVRAHVDASIDRIETALGELKDAGLITVERDGDRTCIYPDPKVVPDPTEPEPEPSLVEKLRDRLPF